MTERTEARRPVNLDKDLLGILCCPDTKQEVRLARECPDCQVKCGGDQWATKNRANKPVTEPLDGGLIRGDRKILYPIREDIPVMLIEEGIPLEGINLAAVFLINDSAAFAGSALQNEAPRSSLLRRNSRFGCEGRKLRGILRNSPKPLPSFAKATEGSPRLHPRSGLLRRSSHFGYEGRKLRGIRRRRITRHTYSDPHLCVFLLSIEGETHSPRSSLRRDSGHSRLLVVRLGAGRRSAVLTEIFVQIARREHEEESFPSRGCHSAGRTVEQCGIQRSELARLFSRHPVLGIELSWGIDRLARFG